MEWNAICRVCLQEGSLEQLFTDTGDETALSLKYNQCSPTELVIGTNMPEHICVSCIGDLEVAYRFRTNCESADAILKSFVTVSSTETHRSYQNAEPYNFQRLPHVQDDKSTPTTIEVPVKFEYVNINEYDKILQTGSPEKGDEVDEEQFLLHNDVATENGFVEYIDEKDNVILKLEAQEEMEKGEANAATDTDLVSAEVEFDLECDASPDYNAENDSDVSLIGEEDQTGDEIVYQVDDYSVVMHIKPVKSNQSRLASHVKLSTLIEPGSDFSAAALLNQEANTLRVKRIFNDPKPMKVCDICGNQYKYQHALESHLRRHRNDKPFTCNVCGKGFVINFELSRHMRTHTGHKPYACKFCDRKFSDFGSRIKHERTHTGERPYQCETCDKAFAYSHVLASHMLTHTGIKNYKCDRCGKRFTKSHHLKAHMNTHERDRAVRFAFNSSNLSADEKYMVTAMANEDDSQQEVIADEMGRQYGIDDLDEDDKATVHLININSTDIENC